MIVFDLSRPNTLDSVRKWKADIDSKVRLPDPNESPIPVILLANKVFLPQQQGDSHFLSQSDLVKNAINPSQLDQYCRDNGIVKWFETSAKDNINVEDAANFLVKQILETESQSRGDSESDSDAVRPDDANMQGGGGNCAC